eukprot:SAG31_NODE_4893_length_2881_cov_1.559310_2_plen_257_part_00
MQSTSLSPCLSVANLQVDPLLNFSHPSFNPLLSLIPAFPSKAERLSALARVDNERTRWLETWKTPANQWRYGKMLHNDSAGLAGQLVPAATAQKLFELYDRSERTHWIAELPSAAASGDLEGVQRTLAWFAANHMTNEALDQQDDGGWSPFWHALFNGHFSVAMLLLDCGADPELRDRRHVSPYLHACQIGNLALAQWLHVFCRANIWAAPFDGLDAFVGACPRSNLLRIMAVMHFAIPLGDVHYKIDVVHLVLYH